jgi:type III secretory pathway component EscU
MLIAAIIYFTFVILNIIFIVPLFLKDLKDGKINGSFEYFAIFFIVLVPILNIVSIVYFTNDFISYFKEVKKEKNDLKKEKKNLKKHPELASIEVLKNIREFLIQEDSKGKDVSESILFVNDLYHLIDALNTNHHNTDIKNLLLENEITLARSLSIIKESTKINTENDGKLILYFKEILEHFSKEVYTIIENSINKENELQKDTEKAILSRLTEEMIEEREFQKKRSFISS